MAMTAGPSSGMAGASPMVDINTTPLVDVMLVLLIIFMITAPLLTHKISINLPQLAPEKADLSQIIQRQLVLHDLGGSVEIRLDDEPISLATLLTEFREQGAKPTDQQNAYKLRADEGIRYSEVADILAAAKRSSVLRIGIDQLGTPSTGEQAIAP